MIIYKEKTKLHWFQSSFPTVPLPSPLFVQYLRHFKPLWCEFINIFIFSCYFCSIISCFICGLKGINIWTFSVVPVCLQDGGFALSINECLFIHVSLFIICTWLALISHCQHGDLACPLPLHRSRRVRRVLGLAFTPTRILIQKSVRQRTTTHWSMGVSRRISETKALPQMSVGI